MSSGNAIGTGNINNYMIFHMRVTWKQV